MSIEIPTIHHSRLESTTVDDAIAGSSFPSLSFPALLWLFLGTAMICCGVIFGSDSTPTVSSKYEPRPVSIEDVQLGWRVVGENPLGPESAEAEPDAATWKKVVLHGTSANETPVEVEFLRSSEWIATNEVSVGAAIILEVSENHLSGVAEVVSIDSCPEIKPGTGSVVTGLFRHRCNENELVRVTFDSDAAPIIGTHNHPFWSETRQAFIYAGHLMPGEQLRTIDKSIVGVSSVKRIAGTECVFNLETHNQHVYTVGEGGILVHNVCGGDVDQRTPVARKGQESNNNFVKNSDGSPRNSPSTIQGRDFSGHALDRMQERGLVPSVIENAIANGRRVDGNEPGTSVFEDIVNKVSVVLNKDQKVITVFPGIKKNR